MVSVILGGTLELDLSLHRPPRLSPADQRRTSSTTQLEELEAEELELALALATMEAEAGEAEEAEGEEGEEAERPLQGTWAPRIGVRVTAEAAALAGALAASAEYLVQLERRRQ
eukprot:scaffold97635_cov60-Phaeocystis_antarctica.AAC.4